MLLQATNQIYKEIKKQRIKLDIKNWTNSYLKERKDFLINRDKDNLGKNFPIQPKGLFKQLRKVLPKDSCHYT
jgi:glyoxylate carboligase